MMIAQSSFDIVLSLIGSTDFEINSLNLHEKDINRLGKSLRSTLLPSQLNDIQWYILLVWQQQCRTMSRQSLGIDRMLSSVGKDNNVEILYSKWYTWWTRFELCMAPSLMRSCHRHSNKNMKFVCADLMQECLSDYTPLQPRRQWSNWHWSHSSGQSTTT